MSVETMTIKSENKYRNLFLTMSQGVVYQDFEGRVIEANPAAERILGLTFNQMRGLTSVSPEWRCIHEDGSDFPGREHPAMVSLRTGCKSQAVMGVFNPVSVGYTWINVMAVPYFREGEAEPYQVFTTFDNISAWHEMHQFQTKQAIDLEQKVKERIAESEKLYNLNNAILNAVPDLLFILDREGAINYSRANDQGMLYVPPEVFIGKRIADILPPGIAEPAMMMIKETFSTGLLNTFEYELKINGQIHYFEDRIIAISDLEVLSIIRDITDRKINEKFLRLQRDLALALRGTSDLQNALNLIFDSLLKIDDVSCGGIYLMDTGTGGLALKVHRGLSEDFIERSSFYSAEDPQTRLVKSGEIAYGRYSDFVNVEADTVPDEGILGLAVLPIIHESNVIGCLNLGSKSSDKFYQNIKSQLEAFTLQIGPGITRIQSDNELLTTQQNFRMLFDRIDDFLFILDLQGNIIKTNPVVRERLGYSNEELLNLSVLNVHPPERREEAGRIVGEMMAGKTLFCPVPLQTKAGGLISVETRVVKGTWDNKEVLYGISRDITELKKLEDSLRKQMIKEKELNELKSKFIAVASHEFRTPLSNILASAESLLFYRNRLTDEQIDGRIHKITDQVDYLKEIISQVVQLSKMQTGNIPFSPEPFDLSKFCLKIIEEFRSNPETRNYIDFKSSPASIPVIMDGKIMRQILTNLISNAIKYSPGLLPLRVHIKQCKKEMILIVRDQGIGIPEADMKYLFTPFFRGSNIGNVPGTGLGLNIIQESVQLHGGKVDVQSRVGEGTTIRLTFPNSV